MEFEIELKTINELLRKLSGIFIFLFACSILIAFVFPNEPSLEFYYWGRLSFFISVLMLFISLVLGRSMRKEIGVPLEINFIDRQWKLFLILLFVVCPITFYIVFSSGNIGTLYFNESVYRESWRDKPTQIHDYFEFYRLARLDFIRITSIAIVLSLVLRIVTEDSNEVARSLSD